MHAITLPITVIFIWCCQHTGFWSSAEEYEYTPFDGWFNNRINPSWGGAETQLLRRLPSAYKDGSYEPSGSSRPNPIELSDALMNGSTGFGSVENRTALLVFFGQQVVEEILDAQRPGCPIEYFNIPVPKGHAKFDPEDEGDQYIPFLRSRYDQRTGLSPNNPRQQLNEISSYIDGTLIYGPNKAWADGLRVFKDGLLAATNDTDPNEKYFPAYNDIRLPFANPPPPRDHHLKPVKRFFKIGNPRGNENPFLLTFGILWFRYHNFKARQLKANHPDWSDEKLFNEARKWVIAVHQRIVAYEWLPAWLGDHLEPYSHYDPTVNPGIVQEFQSAAMRFGHTLVPPGVYRRDANCTFRPTTQVTGFSGHKALRTCNTYWNPQESIQESDIDELLMGMASQIAEREDNIITPDLRGDVFGPLEFSRRDLMALNIQRARDHGLGDYNTARQQYKLPRITQWKDINPNPEIIKALKTIYNNDLSNVDIWVGGLLETTSTGPGPLFRTIIKDQFNRIRNGDRFWFENYELNGLFNMSEVNEINQTSLKDVILVTTNIPDPAIQDDPFHWRTGDQCPQPKQLEAHDIDDVSECTPLKHFDYFSGSELSFILSFTSLAVFLVVTIVTLVLCGMFSNQKNTKERAITRQKTARSQSARMPVVAAFEWVGKRAGEREIFVKFDVNDKRVIIQTKNNVALRQINIGNLAKLNTVISVTVTNDSKRPMIWVKIPKEYDVVLRFDDTEQRDKFQTKLEDLLRSAGVQFTVPVYAKENAIKKQAVTKGKRSKLLERFIRLTFSHAFKYEGEDELKEVNAREAKEILEIELTPVEFGEAMGLKPKSTFVESMFNLMDKDSNGYVSFREFLDTIVIFAKGNGQDKARLLFDMYDLDRSGSLKREQFKMMMRSLMELGNDELDESKADELLDNLLESTTYGDKESLTFQDFSHVLNDYEKELNYASLDWNDSKCAGDLPTLRTPNRARQATMTVAKAYSAAQKGKRYSLVEQLELKTTLPTKQRTYPKSKLDKKINAVTSWFERNRLQIFWATLYSLVSLGIFMERSYYYSVEREHRGLRRMAGFGITVTRGAASGIMWTYSTILITTCRNTITFLRETFLHKWIPFDYAIDMHKYIAAHALFFTVLHCIGHSINFYHISTQTADDLTCHFRDYYHATDELPKFHYWLFSTVTGFTGFILAILMILLFVFAVPYARSKFYRAFWYTHNLYVLVFFFTILHGAGRLVQPPLFHFFFLGPVILFTVDKVISISRKKIEIAVIKAELLPSDVTYIEFKKPNNFHYKSGQWARIASLSQSHNEYHPFTLTSAPHEDTLAMHIRAVGPWTRNLRKIYDPTNLKNEPNGPVILPKIYLDGPYGEGHQDWYKYDVAVLVGGGIGVTPFASILKDLLNRSQGSRKFKCKKVYFLWITRTQKQFEWMTDIIRAVEDNDTRDLISVHIFITQFKEKFDIRTTMLYICERHFQKISDRSLLTGLRSMTHFGRPDFEAFFNTLLTQHQSTSVFGVFSCGPPPMTTSVDNACSRVNRNTTNALLVHHYENF